MQQPQTYRVRLPEPETTEIRRDASGYILLSERDVERITDRILEKAASTGLFERIIKDILAKQ